MGKVARMCLFLGSVLVAIAASAGTAVGSGAITTHTVRVGPMDQIQIAIGRGYLSATCGQLPSACNQSQEQAVINGVCLTGDSVERCQAKMDARALPTVSYKKSGVAFSICIPVDTRAECNTKMETRCVARSRRLKYRSINPDDGIAKAFEFCMSSVLQESGEIVYGSLSDADCFVKTVSAGLWPHPRSESIPQLDAAGKWSQRATRRNDMIFIGKARSSWSQEVAGMTGVSTLDVDELEEP